MIDAKFLAEHSKKCRIGNGDPYTWCERPVEIIKRAVDGSKRGADYAWLVFQCNDPLCPGRLMVSVHSIFCAL